MHTLKLTQIGNSVGVILPKEALARLKLQKGVRILADGTSVRERLVLRKMHTGLSRREAEQFVGGSDLPNVALCATMQRADVTLRLTDTGDYVRVEEP